MNVVFSLILLAAALGCIVFLFFMLNISKF